MHPHLLFKFALTLACASGLLQIVCAQDLSPRAYMITPLHSNAVTLVYSFSDGGIAFEGAVPITDSNARISTSVVSLYHSLRLFGRSANFTAVLPYSVGNFSGKVLSNETNVYRSGLLDSSYRFSVNLIGGPAMDGPQFVKWRQKLLLGASLKVVAPTGQYDPTKLIN